MKSLKKIFVGMCFMSMFLLPTVAQAALVASNPGGTAQRTLTITNHTGGLRSTATSSWAGRGWTAGVNRHARNGMIIHCVGINQTLNVRIASRNGTVPAGRTMSTTAFRGCSDGTRANRWRADVQNTTQHGTGALAASGTITLNRGAR